LVLRQGPETAASLLRRAIAGRLCVSATYNRGWVRLAPYVLYEKDGALFLDAVTLERDGQPPREPKLGAFRLSGLSAVLLTSESFEPIVEVQKGQARYDGAILFRV
jgi:hypothetical protein